MDPNFQSRYLESTDEPAEAVDPLAEPHMPPTPTLGEPVGLDPAPYRPEDQYTEVLPAVTAPGPPPRHAVADAAGPRTGPQAAARPAQPAAAHHRCRKCPAGVEGSLDVDTQDVAKDFHRKFERGTPLVQCCRRHNE